MDDIKDVIDNQKSGIKKLFYNYTITLLCVAIISILCCFDANYGGKDDLGFLCYYFLLIFSAGALFIETNFVEIDTKKPIKKLIIGFLVVTIFATGWTLLYAFGDGIEIMREDGSISYNLYNFFFLKLWYVYLVSMILLSLYKLIKKSQISVDIYIGRAFFGVLIVIALNIILILALEFILEIFDRLIVEIPYWDYLEDGIKLLSGFVICPYCLYKLTNTKEDNSSFTKSFVNYVLMPCVMLAILFVYMYILKLLINWELPSNEVFGICMKIFVIGAPIWLISYGYLRIKANINNEPLSFYGKLVKNIKYAYIPLIILEILAISIRINSYGITEDRYLAVVAIIFQIIYILWELIGKILKKQLKQEALLIVAVVLYAITMIAPVINYNKLSYISQKNRFEAAMESKDYVAAKSGLHYLMNNKYGADYIRANYTPEERRSLYALFNGEEDSAEEYGYYRIEIEVYSGDIEEGLDIREYSKSIPFKYDSQEEKNFTFEELEGIQITWDGAESSTRKVNIRPLVEKYVTVIDRNVEKLKYNESMHYQYIEVDDNTCVVIEKIYFEYNPNINKNRNIKLKGYVLTNE